MKVAALSRSQALALCSVNMPSRAQLAQRLLYPTPASRLRDRLRAVSLTTRAETSKPEEEETSQPEEMVGREHGSVRRQGVPLGYSGPPKVTVTWGTKQEDREVCLTLDNVCRGHVQCRLARPDDQECNICGTIAQGVPIVTAQQEQGDPYYGDIIFTVCEPCSITMFERLRAAYHATRPHTDGD